MFAGWDGVIVLRVVERSIEGMVTADAPEYQKIEGCTG
jgi:hypothetical protein